ncbi:hypothetical protein CLAFUW4_10740 [Fulvia fulva]|uniref:Uncharacterized protein n=1 Tax=Passalora fulva TaxID=5499 RepID=A0A9Q8LEP8_PASFU|nr:uncharacterized protein CLAFUR5_05353 [Fulvia fulva]KAK4615951.1 hypothetical protein CLAFUR4_10745 [Fulvia fulva]KAK4616522.1 hypothetical protein CLAFUR0_10752 [Fulvia fulva]UJO16046.1 hypothetical protein CLAFUR5_05353 [Fulvia fulva]WPV19740.1 hypothetical protein CLAFUW4_10740 [Fulvia fulva]WPV33707.1 hypothetical protein CLAFUW7_10742 [Fulvia fulva]
MSHPRNPFARIPDELAAQIVGYNTPDLVLATSAHTVLTNGRQATMKLLELKNKSEWSDMISLRSASKSMKEKINDNLGAILRTKQSIVVVDTKNHLYFGYPYPLDPQDLSGGALQTEENAYLPDDFLGKPTFGNGETWEVIRTTVPITLVDMKAHVGSLEKGKTLRDLAVDDQYRGDDAETLLLIEFQWSQNRAAKWDLSCSYHTLAEVGAEREDDWMEGYQNSNLPKIKREAMTAIKQYLISHNGINRTLDGLNISTEAILEVQKAVCGLSDHLASLPNEWTTRPHERSMWCWRLRAFKGKGFDDGEVDQLLEETDSMYNDDSEDEDMEDSPEDELMEDDLDDEEMEDFAEEEEKLSGDADAYPEGGAEEEEMSDGSAADQEDADTEDWVDDMHGDP